VCLGLLVPLVWSEHPTAEASTVCRSHKPARLCHFFHLKGVASVWSGRHRTAWSLILLVIMLCYSVTLKVPRTAYTPTWAPGTCPSHRKVRSTRAVRCPRQLPRMLHHTCHAVQCNGYNSRQRMQPACVSVKVHSAISRCRVLRSQVTTLHCFLPVSTWIRRT
jgi:hypothetical protein